MNEKLKDELYSIFALSREWKNLKEKENEIVDKICKGIKRMEGLI